MDAFTRGGPMRIVSAAGEVMMNVGGPGQAVGWWVENGRQGDWLDTPGEPLLSEVADYLEVSYTIDANGTVSPTYVSCGGDGESVKILNDNEATNKYTIREVTEFRVTRHGEPYDETWAFSSRAAAEQFVRDLEEADE